MGRESVIENADEIIEEFFEEYLIGLSQKDSDRVVEIMTEIFD